VVKEQFVEDTVVFVRGYKLAPFGDIKRKILLEVAAG